jgi:hypothetical protein
MKFFGARLAILPVAFLLSVPRKPSSGGRAPGLIGRPRVAVAAPLSGARDTVAPAANTQMRQRQQHSKRPS